MTKKILTANMSAQTLNVAIVGGGRACKYILELIRNEPFPFLNINIVGVCDIDPKAEGFVMAEKMGIFTTHDFQDLFKIKSLDSIIEITGNRDVLLDIIRLRPKGVGVLEHNIGRLLRNLYDVAQRLESAEQQLVRKKMFSDFLIQQSTAAIVILNTDFTIVDTNEAYLKAVNKPKEAVLGKYCYKVSHGLEVPCSSSHPELECPLLETLRTGKSAHVIHEHPVPGGQPTYCNMVTYPLRDRAGEIDRVIEVWRDLTEEFSNQWNKRVKELKSDFQKLIEEDRLVSLGKLAASCAHEINNPIQGLLMFSSLMEEILQQRKPSDEDLDYFKKHLSLMSRELERCGNIVSSLLSFSRDTSLEFKNIDLNETLSAVINLTRHTMALRNIDLEARLSPASLMIHGNESRLHQCFFNLVFNAIEAMPDGGQLRIVSELDKTNNKATVHIKDTGCGIHKENLPHIFDPFFTTKGEGKGTGLGLSIVYGVTKNHKGNITIDSNVGKGTLFTLTFPSV
jgi:signal transduction histidine kinase